MLRNTCAFYSPVRSTTGRNLNYTNLRADKTLIWDPRPSMRLQRPTSCHLFVFSLYFCHFPYMLTTVVRKQPTSIAVLEILVPRSWAITIFPWSKLLCLWISTFSVRIVTRITHLSVLRLYTLLLRHVPATLLGGNFIKRVRRGHNVSAHQCIMLDMIFFLLDDTAEKQWEK